METNNPFEDIKTCDSYARLFKLFLILSLSAAVLSVIVLRVGNRLLGLTLVEDEVTNLFSGIAYIAFCVSALKTAGVDLAAAWRDWNARITGDLLLALKYFGSYLLVLAAMSALVYAAAHLFSSSTTAVLGHVGAAEERYNEMRSVMVSGAPRFAFMLLTVCVLVPCGEELFFRRLLYAALRKRHGFVPALLLSSSLFALAHLAAALLVFPVGLLLGYLYEKERRLPANIILHGLVNLFVVLMRVAS